MDQRRRLRYGAVLAVVAAAACARTERDVVPADAIVVDVDGRASRFDRRLLGTNVPAWLGPELLASAKFVAMVRASGVSMLRFPGGSWSNGYDWAACEEGDATRCAWTWAARPTDFLNLIADTDLPAMWTVSANATAEEAAALVAFFNGAVDDDREIGRDGRGRDWGTIGEWARLRSDHGNPVAHPIRSWEIGNEVFAAEPSAGPDCASFGWEDVWTCDGAEYVSGDGDHDGYLEIRAAMKAVDPDISVGAVGVPDAASWNGWGAEVLGAAGDELDFYVIHNYGFDEPPDPDHVLREPAQQWPSVMSSIEDSFAEHAGGRDIAVAVTEYNLVAFQDADPDRLMTQQLEALYLAETIGRMAESGIDIAAQWNFANGDAPNGTDYGLVDPDSLERNPSYYALVLWSRFADELVPVEVGRDLHALSVYAGRSADGTVTLLVINGDVEMHRATIDLGDVRARYGVVDVVDAASLASTAVEYNGVDEPSLDLREPGARLDGVESSFDYRFPAVSMSLLTLHVTGGSVVTPATTLD